VEDPYLGQVARVVADGDGLADISCQRRVEVAQALEVNAVTPDAARLGVHDQEQVKVFQAIWAARQEAAAPPGVERCLAGLAVTADVVRAGDEGADGPVQLCQGQARRGRRLAAGEVPGQLGQQLGVERAEQALDLAPALRPGDSRVDDAEAEAGSDLFEVVAGEVAAVIDVEHVRDAANRPGTIGLAPDGVSQGEAGVQHAWRVEEHGVAGDGARVIVHDRGQPGAGRLAALVKDVEVEQRVVRLPDRVGCFGTEAVDQLKAVPERGRPLLRQCYHAWVEGGDDRVDRAVGRNAPALCSCGGADPAVDGSSRRPRRLQRHAFNQRDDICGPPMRAGITADGACQPGHAALAVTRQPTPCCPDRDTGRVGGARQGNAVLQVRAKHGETDYGLLALLLVLGRKGCRRLFLPHADAPCPSLTSTQSCP